MCAKVLPLSVCLGLLAASAPIETASTNEEGVGPMLAAFSVGALGTVIGCLLGYVISVSCGLFSANAAACAASLYCATYIGGSVNFFAVASATDATRLDGLLPSLMAADLGLMGLYLLVLTAASRCPPLLRLFPQPEVSHIVAPSPKPRAIPATATSSAIHRSWSLGIAVIAFASCHACTLLEQWLRVPGSSTIALSLGSAAVGRWISQQVPSTAQLLRNFATPSLFLSCIFLGGIGASARLSQACHKPIRLAMGRVPLVRF